MRGNNMHEEEIRNINTLITFGLSNAKISEIVGRSPNTISRIRSGSYEGNKAKMRQYNAAHKEQKVTQETAIEKPEISLRANDLSYTNTLLNALLMKLTMLCEALGVEDNYGT